MLTDKEVNKLKDICRKYTELQKSIVKLQKQVPPKVAYMTEDELKELVTCYPELRKLL